MKKILKSLLAITLIVGFTNNVNAVSLKKGEEFSITEKPITFVSDVKCPGCYYNESTGTLEDDAGIIEYTLSNGVKAYCLDVNLAAPTKVQVKEVVDASSAYYAGLMAIANNSKGKSYASVNLALRLFQMAMGESTKTLHDNFTVNGAAAQYNYVLSNTAAYLMNTEVRSEANSLLDKKCKNAKCFWNTLGVKGKKSIGNRPSYLSSDRLTGDGLKGAKSLFIKAFEAAKEYKDDINSANPSVTLSKRTKISQSQVVDEKVVSVNKHILKVKNFGEDDYIKDLSLSCENCGNDITLSVSYSDGGREVNGIPSNRVLKSLKNNESLVLKVTASIPVAKFNAESCEETKYKFSYSFFNSKNTSEDGNGKIYILDGKGKDVQDFSAIVVDGSNGDDNGDDGLIPKARSSKINLCNPDACLIPENPVQDDPCCEDWNKACKDDPNSNYCKLYDDYCDNTDECHTSINLPSYCESSDTTVTSGTTGSIKSDLDKNEKENIELCVLKRKEDDATEPNSYALESYADNNYCDVYCKEDFDFEFPTIKSVNSGTYFSLDAKITGTKKCFTSEIDTEGFLEDINKVNSKYASATNDYKKEFDRIVNEYNACVNMANDSEIKSYSCFNPTIEYEYDEDAYKDIVSRNNKFVKTSEEVTSSSTQCNSSINSDYSCTDSSTTGRVTISKHGSGNINIATTNYASSIVTKEAKYSTPDVFYTINDGSVTIDADAKNATKIDGLPVSTKTEKGRHNFKLTLSDIGTFYDEDGCVNGRLVGTDKSVFNSQKGKTKTEYQCFYDVNCPECDFSCEGEMCEIDDCDGPNCVATCLGNGCAYDQGAGLSYGYRTITLNNLNPTNRTLGYNWNAAKSAKAASAISEIETSGEEAYTKAEYKITLTPALLSAIKEYNNEQLANGGYVNDTLDCGDVTVNGVTFNNVNCESTFIKDLADDNNFRGVRVNVAVPSKKFTSWLESKYCESNVCEVKKLSGTGPSYK